MCFYFIFCWAGVAGGAASGKTPVCDLIIEQLHDQRVVLVNQVSHFSLGSGAEPGFLDSGVN